MSKLSVLPLLSFGRRESRDTSFAQDSSSLWTRSGLIFKLHELSTSQFQKQHLNFIPNSQMKKGLGWRGQKTINFEIEK